MCADTRNQDTQRGTGLLIGHLIRVMTKYFPAAHSRAGMQRKGQKPRVHVRSLLSNRHAG